ncbi:hypothetical protein SAMN05216516_101557 [Izhakiella capsodis]|uniref:Uncharacterized protein n=1 Tax=Izhakiella capsodis TaxID=1367852 RepID=A0A1I4V573_9GAMM|nr:hypothetical protein SAMN05216516_101557 [Izhakiella capsodis]
MVVSLSVFPSGEITSGRPAFDYLTLHPLLQCALFFILLAGNRAQLNPPAPSIRRAVKKVLVFGTVIRTIRAMHTLAVFQPAISGHACQVYPEKKPIRDSHNVRKSNG